MAVMDAAMNDHFPECAQGRHATYHVDTYWCDEECESDCICDTLRDVEKRAADEAFHRGYAAGMQVEHDNGIKYGQRRYREALENVRQAVLGITKENEFYPIEVHNTIIDVLAEIDELIKNPRIL